MKVVRCIFFVLMTINIMGCNLTQPRLADNTALVNNGTIYGKVTHQGRPVKNVVLNIMKTNCFGFKIRSTLSNEQGDYRFDALPANIILKLSVNNFHSMDFYLANNLHIQGPIKQFQSTCGAKKEGFNFSRRQQPVKHNIALEKK